MPGDEDGNGLADCDDPACSTLFHCPTCGNGVLQSGEACDGTLTRLSCAAAGFEFGVPSCTDECELDTSTCRNPVCGDGTVEGAETCDDGNTTSGDGCSDTCMVEGDTCATAVNLNMLWDESDEVAIWQGDITGFSSDFTSSCADTSAWLDAVASFTAPAEGTYEFVLDALFYPALWAWEGTCDQPGAERACKLLGVPPLNRIVVDLLSQETVHVAVGAWAGRGTFSLTVAPLLCGDGRVGGTEECDDGNLLDGDGCSSSCTLPGTDCLNPIVLDSDYDPVAEHWHWTGQRAADGNGQTGSCGDFSGSEVIATFTAPQAGTYAVQLTESYPIGALHISSNACGAATDAILCVDASDSSGRVEATVPLQANETIFMAADRTVPLSGTSSLSVGEVVCGDGHRRGGSEECDDGNLADGDGCSSSCRLETTDEVEPNDTFATATPFAAQLPTPPITFGRGEIDTATDVDLWSFQATAGTLYTAFTATRTNLGCGRLPTDDTVLTIYDGAGTILHESDDVSPTNLCSNVFFSPPITGTYFAQVTAPNAIPGYFLLVVPH